MTDVDICLTCTGSALGVLGAAVYVAFLVEHRDDIAESWRDGVDQLWLWRQGLTPLGRRVLDGLLVVAVWLVALATPAPHGQHRAEAA